MTTATAARKPAAAKKEVVKPGPAASAVTAPKVNEADLIKKGKELQTEVSALAITNQEGYNAAAVERAKIKQHIEYLEGIFGPAKKALNKAVLDLRNEEKKLIGPRLAFANDLLDSLNTSMKKWLIAEDKRVADEKRIADEDERKRVDAEKAKLLKQADKAEDKGKEEKAEALREAANNTVFVPAPARQAVSFAGTGTSAKDDIDYTVTDTRLCLKWLLDSGVDMDTVVEFKRKGMKDFMKTQEFPEGEISFGKPGVTVTKTKILAGR